MPQILRFRPVSCRGNEVAVLRLSTGGEFHTPVVQQDQSLEQLFYRL